MRKNCSLGSSVTKAKKKNVGYREGGITSHIKGQWGICHKIKRE